MALSPMKPDQHKAHTFVVASIEKTEKTFNSADGMKQKYIIRFKNDYAAEYCPLISVGPDKRIKEGDPFTFRIAYRKDYADEIVPYTVPSEMNKDNPESLQGAVININGHPAVTAMNTAGHIYASKIKAGIDEETYGLSSMLEDADLIFKWLIDKVNNPNT